MTDCDDLHARADMLHQEAERGRSKAKAKGPGWDGYRDQLDIAAKCEDMASNVAAKIAEDC